jgi:hypothetical protein
VGKRAKTVGKITQALFLFAPTHYHEFQVPTFNLRVVVKLLLATGKADVNAKNKWGQTPLPRAAAQGHEAIVKLLEPLSAL